MPALSINSSVLLPGFSFCFRSSSDCDDITTTGRVASEGLRCADAVTAMIRRNARPIRVSDDEDLIKRKGRKVFRKGRRGKPLRSFAKTSASFAFKILSSWAFKLSLDTTSSFRFEKHRLKSVPLTFGSLRVRCRPDRIPAARSQLQIAGLRLH